MFLGGASWVQALVGAGRLIADGGYGDDGRMMYVGCALHRTGAGAFAASLGPRPADQSVTKVADQFLTTGVIGGLRFLATHARDRAAAGGSASLRATIVPITEDRPAQLSQINSSFQDRLGLRSTTSAPVAEAVADLDELAEGGSAHLSAAYALSTGLTQEFGHPEVQQLTHEGKLRLQYWHPGVRSQFGSLRHGLRCLAGYRARAPVADHHRSRDVCGDSHAPPSRRHGRKRPWAEERSHPPTHRSRTAPVCRGRTPI
jgi:hypothetical protein